MPGRTIARRTPKAADPTRRVTDLLCRRWLRRLLRNGQTARGGSEAKG